MNKKLLILVSILSLLAIVFLTVKSDVFSSVKAYCKASGTDTNYCKYEGKITGIYLNSDNLYLIFLESSFSTENAKEYGYSINSGKAIALSTDKNPTREQFMTMLNIALINDLSVEIHARDVNSGYMELDRLWVKK